MRTLKPIDLQGINATKMQHLVPFQFWNKDLNKMVAINRMSGSYFLEPCSTVRWTMTTIKNTCGEEPNSKMPKKVAPKISAVSDLFSSPRHKKMALIKEQIQKLQTELLELDLQKDYISTRLTPSQFANGNILGKVDMQCLYKTDLINDVPNEAERCVLHGLNFEKTRFMVGNAIQGDKSMDVRVTELFLIKPLT